MVFLLFLPVIYKNTVNRSKLSAARGCPGSVWAGAHSHTTALAELSCAGTQKGAAHSPGPWLCLSSAGTAAMLPLQHSHLACGLGVGKSLAGAMARRADAADQRDIPCQYDVCSAMKGGCRGHLLSQCLFSVITAAPTEALLPGYWLANSC